MEDQLLNLIQNLNYYLTKPFWQDYNFLISILGIIVLGVTLFFLIKYTKATEELKDETVKQTKLEQMPVMVMYVRNIEEYMFKDADYNEQQKILRKVEPYLIRIRSEGEKSHYFLNLRNTGNGTAFNLEVESDIFEVSKYKSRFFAPLKDEHSIAIIKKNNKKIESWDELNGSIFKIHCDNVLGQSYCFKYKIIDIKNKEVEFIGIEQN